MTFKEALNQLIRGWLPKETKISKNTRKMAETKVPKTMPQWWKFLWILTITATIISGIVSYFLFDIQIGRIIGGIILTFMSIGFAYYIRVRPSLRRNRAIYILLGITPIGFVLMVMCVFIVNRLSIISSFDAFPILLVCGVASFGFGAMIGDWIGKRRNYAIPLSP